MIRIGLEDLDHTERTLVSLCRRNPELDPADLAEPEQALGVRALAAEQKVSGLVLDAVHDHPRTRELPARVVDRLLGANAERRRGTDFHRSYDEVCATASDQERELAELLSGFAADGLAPVVLKGPALRHTVYERPVQRRYADFDLLFESHEIDRAYEIARDVGYAFPFSPERLAGYRAHHFHILMRKQERYRAEIHWLLTPPDTGVELDAESFRRRAREIRTADGMSMRIPAPEHLLLHMAHENLRDSCSRLARIVDVDRILVKHPDLDWDLALSEIRAGGLDGLVALATELAHGLLGAPVPDELRRNLHLGPGARIHLSLMRPAPSLLRRSLAGAGTDVTLLHWLTVGARRRLAMLGRMLSGRIAARQWIFRSGDDRPPTWRESAVVGLKSGARFVLCHARLYLDGARRRLGRDRREA